MTTRYLMPAVLLMAVPACRDLTVPAPNPQIAFHLNPTVVRSGDTIQARLVVHNRSDTTVRLTSGCGTLSMRSTSRNGESIAIQGGNLGCLTVVRTFEIGPRDSVVEAHPIVALVNEGSPGWKYVLPAPPGVYEVKVYVQVHVPLKLPDQAARFEVVP